MSANLSTFRDKLSISCKFVIRRLRGVRLLGRIGDVILIEPH